MNNILSEQKKLTEQLNIYAHKYYTDDNPSISDLEYDKLFDQLVQLENKTGIIFSNSPTQEIIGDTLSHLNKIEHTQKMLSTQKTKDIDDIVSFAKVQSVIISPKMDGISIILRYDKGKIDKCITRGNGKIGEDITANISMFTNVPYNIPINDSLEIRGEGVISYDTFEMINSSLNEKYKNPRNLASGSLRRKEKTDKSFVTFFAFEIIDSEMDFKLESDALNFLKELGFDIVQYTILDSKNDKVNNFINSFNVNDFSYPLDGLIIKYNNIEYGISLGETSHHRRNMIALKWADEVVETTLRNIEWNTSRTGILTPVAVFDPVEIEGTIIERASIHNLSIVEELKLGIGDIIQVYKANMIIPQILCDITSSNTCEPPEFCSSCGEPVVIEYSETGVKTVVCHNNDCPAQIMFRLKHFCSRDAMNIKGLSTATLETLVEQGWLNNLYDIYELKNYKQKMIRLPRFGEKSVSNILDAIENSRHVDLPNFLYSLGISAMGRSNSKLLCEHFDNDLNKIRNADFNSLMRIDGFGPETTREIINFFGDKDNSDMINILLQYISFNKPQEPIEIKESSVTGKAFVVTGDLNHFKNRKELEALIVQNGGINKSSISKLVDYLVNNDINSESSKNKKAKELGIPIISEEDLLNMIG